MRLKIYYICAVLLILILSVPAALAQDAQEEHLVGWWLFDTGKDEIGNWDDITLHGAEFKDGQLIVETTKWAHALEYTGPEIQEKTLMSWISLDSLDINQNGSAITLDKVTIDQFNGIIYSERLANRWMNGSSHFRRTQDFPDGVEEKKVGEMVFLAITYEDDDGNYKVTGYRNGESLGSYTQGVLKTWPKGDAEILWGKRHTGAGINGPGHLNAHIEESRIYDVPLTQDEIQSLEIGTLSVEPQGKLAISWAKLKTE